VINDHFTIANGTKKAVQNPVQQPAVSTCNGLHAAKSDASKPAICGRIQASASACGPAASVQVGDTGFEPVTSAV
jgi:hypothetical protein